MRATLWWSAALIALLTFFPGSGPASADPTSPALDAQAWYWSSNQSVTPCAGVPPQLQDTGICNPATSSTSPISPKHLGVGAKGGQSDMRTYLHWDLSDMPVGSKVDGMQVVLTVSNPTDQAHRDQHDANKLQPPATAGQALAAIDACLVLNPWGEGEGAPPDAIKVSSDGTTSSVHQEPSIEPSKCYPGQPAADGKSWTFTITKIAQLWADGKEDNNGVALVPNFERNPSGTWTVELHGYAYSTAEETPKVQVSPDDAAKTTLAFTPPETSETTATQPPPPTENVFGGSGEPSFGGVSSPTGLEIAPPPAPATGSTPLAASLPVSRKIKTPGYVWLSVAAGLVGIALLWRALAPEDMIVSENRVASLLRLRQQTRVAP